MSQVDAHLDEIRRKYIAAPLAEAFKAGLEAGFREGAIAMREAAAKAFDGSKALQLVAIRDVILDVPNSFRGD